MFNRHFLKTLIIFTSMIALGLLGVFLVNYFSDTDSGGGITDIEVAR